MSGCQALNVDCQALKVDPWDLTVPVVRPIVTPHGRACHPDQVIIT
jgi:hypothetical protein